MIKWPRSLGRLIGVLDFDEKRNAARKKRGERRSVDLHLMNRIRTRITAMINGVNLNDEIQTNVEIVNGGIGIRIKTQN